MEAAVSCMVELISVMVSDIDWASPRAPRTLSAIFADALLRRSDSAWIDKSIFRMNSMSLLTFPPMTSNSSPESISICLVRSPSPFVSSTILSFRSLNLLLNVKLIINSSSMPARQMHTSTITIVLRRVADCCSTQSMLTSTPTAPTILPSTYMGLYEDICVPQSSVYGSLLDTILPLLSAGAASSSSNSSPVMDMSSPIWASIAYSMAPSGVFLIVYMNSIPVLSRKVVRSLLTFK